MNKNGYLKHRLEVKQMDYEDKKKSLLYLMEEIDSDTFERNAISLLSSMLELKATINELKLNIGMED